jgi:hypothetical protein
MTNPLEYPVHPRANTWIWAELWIWVCTWCSASGWILSALGRLDHFGYICAFAIGVLGLIAGSNRWGWRTISRWRFRRRSGSPLRSVFIIVLALSALGGAMYPPGNYDALTYRIPQALQWLAEGRWFWQSVADNLVNFAPPGQTWIAAPVILFTSSLRPLFLVNIVAFALLPGLIFAIFHRSGVGRRVAAQWMYIVPCAYGFALQAGSIGNDVLAASFVLVAVAFALRANETRADRDLWVAVLAIALATAVKTIILPLMLPVAIATVPALRLALARPVRTVLVLLVAGLVSFLPTAILNQRFTGDWAGDPQNTAKMKMSSPVHAFAGNAVLVVTGMLEPPANPYSKATRAFGDQLLSSRFGAEILKHFPRFQWALGELPIEESAGLGLGIGLLLMCSVIFSKRKSKSDSARRPFARWVLLGGSFAAFFCVVKVGSEGTARHLISYYPLLIGSVLLIGSNESLVRTRAWQRFATGACGLVIVPLMLSPARPLWPAQTILDRIARANPDSLALQRARTIYRLYRQRPDSYSEIRKHIPPGTKVLLYAGLENDPLAALWQPFGTWRVLELTDLRRPMPFHARVRPEESVVIASNTGVRDRFGLTLEEFTRELNADIIAREQVLIKASRGPEEFVVLRLNPYAEIGAVDKNVDR